MNNTNTNAYLFEPKLTGKQHGSTGLQCPKLPAVIITPPFSIVYEYFPFLTMTFNYFKYFIYIIIYKLHINLRRRTIV
jgi:hypothetical protein